MEPGGRKKNKVSDTSPNFENEKVPAIENVSAQVEQTNLDVARKSANCALEEVMEGWRIKGQVGDICHRSLMGKPCSVVEHNRARATLFSRVTVWQPV